ncbi:MAG: hypothetical protein HZB68_01670 [Candidatus Aenigmarchaeota archaeon]|nr:hypothetical protein [Candidatus Aenigmarchaeota archaeon]
MQFKRVAATAIGALLAGATIAMPVLGATDLSNFPAPFVDGGKANFVIVVGSGGEAAGLASDIAGAIDIAARLGGESYTASAGTGASISGGDSKDVPLNLVLSNSAAFDRTVWKNNKIPGLFKGKIDFKAKSINAHEEIVLDDKANDGTAGRDLCRQTRALYSICMSLTRTRPTSSTEMSHLPIR